MSQKTIVITGASSGIGEALALHYAKQGENLVLTGRDRERLDGVAAACERYGAHVSYGVVDVKDKEGLAKFLLEQDAKTPIDVIVANAGISGGTAGLESTQILKQVREIYDVNVMGVINTLEPLVEKMIIRGKGQIALMSSMASYAPWPGAPAYGSSKSAIRFLGHSLRGTLAPHGIKVNVICPGFVKSRITDKNDFSMPFFKDADYAARKIANGLKRNKTTIAFPLPMVCMVSLMRALPTKILIYVNSKMPSKTDI